MQKQYEYQSTNLITTTGANSKEKDYELLDSGNGEKLERFGKVILSRPDPQALWPKKLGEKEWRKSDGAFRDGGWTLSKNIPSKWDIEYGGLHFWLKPTTFKHVGLFPEQLLNWSWMEEKITKDIQVLNLFGYTGGATLACARAGASVVHVDGSKVAIAWARENAELSGLSDRPIRWILDDARDFVRREIKRGKKYSAIIMDPPAFGHGPEGKLWKIEEHFISLVEDCMNLLHEPLFFVINGYSAGYSAFAYENILSVLVAKYGGKLEKGELCINGGGNTLPCGIYARWSRV